MSTLLRFVLPALFVASFAAGATPILAQAVPVLAPNTWSPFTTIQYIRQSEAMGDNATYLMLNGVMCTNAREFRFPESSAHRSLMKNALAALMSSREVRVKHDDCRVYDLWVR